MLGLLKRGNAETRREQAIKDIEKEFNSQIAGAKVEMQKFFKDDLKKEGNNGKENSVAPKNDFGEMVNSVVNEKTKVENKEYSETERKVNPKTGEKDDGDFDQMDSAVKSKTEKKEKLDLANKFE